VADRRRQRGDRSGADEILIRLGSLDPSDFEARLNAARVLAAGGSTAIAAERYRAISADLFEKNRDPEALAALREAVRLNPADTGGRTQLARAYLAIGDLDGTREFLDAEGAGHDPSLLLPLAQAELQGGRTEQADVLLTRLLDVAPSMAAEVTNLAWSFSPSNPQAAFLCIDRASDVASDFQTAAALLQEYVARSTQQVPALLKLVEVCVDGGLKSMMYETQGQLCDAYLLAGKASEARVIAEDLVAREPWEQMHIERFRQALVLLKVSDPDTVIAERLNGQVPFVATDHFMDESELRAAAASSVSPAAPDPPARTGDTMDVVPPSASGDPVRSGPVSVQSTATPEIDMAALQAMLREAEGGDSPGHVEVDLTSALFASGSPTAPAPRGGSLDEVFARARDHAERQPDAEEADEQLKLGKACIEKGLIDDGVHALEQAARFPRQRFEAAATLGRLYRDRHEAASAIEWMERAAEAPSRSADEGHALLYDLGVTLEAAEEHGRALAVFLELLADAGQYRDVQARVDRLSRVEKDS
jgi:tetratricopeptide (TPR) repeat protein